MEKNIFYGWHKKFLFSRGRRRSSSRKEDFLFWDRNFFFHTTKSFCLQNKTLLQEDNHCLILLGEVWKEQVFPFIRRSYEDMLASFTNDYNYSKQHAPLSATIQDNKCNYVHDRQTVCWLPNGCPPQFAQYKESMDTIAHTVLSEGSLDSTLSRVCVCGFHWSPIIGVQEFHEIPGIHQAHGIHATHRSIETHGNTTNSKSWENWKNLTKEHKKKRVGRISSS